ncbi:MAG TPA: hypothetical protein DD473_16120 [Planctomycetaceae bacterium]|nr:hypothetical protein [Planctomycetaceae bacterium]
MNFRISSTVTRPFLLALLLTLYPLTSQACTTVVISGRATIDGRPLLWKNRDTWQNQNEVVHDSSGKYTFVGITNAEASERIYMGTNTAGLCIENSVSRDLAGKATNGPTNGEFIKYVLQNFSTVNQVKEYLEQTDKTGRKTRANFGVIDAKGGAAIFEAGPSSYRMFDANNPHDAPQGFIVRANFSETSRESLPEAEQNLETIYSGIRYQRAFDLCQSQLSDSGLNAEYLLQRIARDVAECPSCCFGDSAETNSQLSKESVRTSSTLNRSMTVSSVVFQGVLPEEAPELTTMWALLGEPLFTIAIPCWASQHKIAKELNGEGVSPLCDLSIRIRSACYEADDKHLITTHLSKLTPQLFSVEQEIFHQTQARLHKSSPQQLKPEENEQMHQQAVDKAFSVLTTLAQKTSQFSVPVSLKNNDPSPTAVDFQFEEEERTRLADTVNSAGDAKWDGGMTDSSVNAGSFQINHNSTTPVTRYVDLLPNIRTKADSEGNPKVPRGWLVIEIAGWNFRGATPNEMVRFGFSSQPEKDLHSAGVVIERTTEDNVSITGLGFGDGSSEITSSQNWPVKLEKPLTLVLEFDKEKGNPDEGETGGEYRIYFRKAGESGFQQLGTAGKIRRLRNGNAIHFRTAGFFAAKKEYFKLDRLYYTTTNPLQ